MIGGLQLVQYDAICAVLAGFPAVEEAQLYGSRAMGTHHPGSDIDLTLLGAVDATTLARLGERLDDLLLPYTFDLSIFDEIDNAELRAHILRVGRVFYRRTSTTRSSGRRSSS